MVSIQLICVRDLRLRFPAVFRHKGILVPVFYQINSENAFNPCLLRSRSSSPKDRLTGKFLLEWSAAPDREYLSIGSGPRFVKLASGCLDIRRCLYPHLFNGFVFQLYSRERFSRFKNCSKTTLLIILSSASFAYSENF